MILLSHTFTAVETAVAGTPVSSVNKLTGQKPRSLFINYNFAGGAGGTSVDAYVQTSTDGGTTWIDLANMHVTTSAFAKGINIISDLGVTTQATFTDGSISANTAVSGFIGELLRVKYTSVGVYTGGGAPLTISASPGY